MKRVEAIAIANYRSPRNATQRAALIEIGPNAVAICDGEV